MNDRIFLLAGVGVFLAGAGIFLACVFGNNSKRVFVTHEFIAPSNPRFKKLKFKKKNEQANVNLG